MKKINNSKVLSFFLIFMLLANLFLSLPFTSFDNNIVSAPSTIGTAIPYIYWTASPNSIGIKETKNLNVSFYRNWLNTTIVWSLQKSTDDLKWVDCTKLLVVDKIWDPVNLSEKHTLTWVADEDAYYQLLLKTDDVKSYNDLSTSKSSQDKILLNFSITSTEDYNIYYDWSDYSKSAEASKTTFSKSVIAVSSKQVFSWNVYTSQKLAKGDKFSIDPTFGDAGLTGASSYEFSNIIVGGYYQMGAIGGIGNSISAKLSITGVNIKVKCALYNSDKSFVTNSETEEKTLESTMSGTVTFNFGSTKPVLIANAWYFIVCWASQPVISIFYKTTTGNGMSVDSETYGSFPNPWGNTTLGSDRLVAIYCTYTTNIAPTFSEPHPANASTNVNRYNLTSIKVNDADGNTMNLTWFTNASGSWVNYGHNNTVGNGTYRQTASWASINSHTYYWKLYANDGKINVSSWYSFRTISASNTTCGFWYDIDSGIPYANNHSIGYVDNHTAFTYSGAVFAPGTRYYARAWASNAFGFVYGAEVSFLTKPNEPTALTATALNETKISLTWTKGTGANNTRIQRKAGSYPTTVSDGLNVYNGTGNSYTNVSCIPGTLYYYRAWSYTQYGTSHQWSDLYSSAYRFTKPYSPTNADIQVIGFSSINLTWTKGIGANRTVIVYKSTGYPTSVTDGIIKYNGTGTSYVSSLINGTIYYFSGFSYSTWGTFSTFCYNATYFSNITGAGFIINCFSESNGTALAFNVQITNQSGSQVYVKNGCTNPETINSSLCPHGIDIQVIVSATGYQQRIYTLNIYTGIFYTLNAYLLPVTPTGTPSGNETSALYYLRVVESVLVLYTQVDQAVEDALVTVQRYINTTGVYVTVSSLYTDANGYVNLYLAPNAYYKVLINKSGYEDKISNYIPAPPNAYGQTVEKVFRIDRITTPTTPEYTDFYTTVVFTASMNSTNVTSIHYYDHSGNTTNTQIYFYEWYNGTTTFLDSNSRTGEQSFYWNISGLNNTRTYLVVLYFNTSNNFNLPENRILVTVYPLNPYPTHSFDLEKRITDNFGQFKIGPQVFTWIGFILSFLPLIILTLFDPGNVGIGILTTGFSMAGIQAVLAAWTINSVNPLIIILTPVIILIGVLYILAQRQGYL